jgi:hypothetical protein
VHAKGRCIRCYQYWHEHGHDRPEDLILRDNIRKFARQAETEAWGGPMPERQRSEGERLRARAEEAARERRARRCQ